jgi:hypothetical protein
MSINKHVPTVGVPLGKPCPVCGKASYSRWGTHPQCALSRADAKLVSMRKKKKSR